MGFSFSGHVEPGYELVREHFELSDFGDGGGAFCAYVAGCKVVDLWGGMASPGVAWGEDTLTTVFSSTKGAAALCIQLLYDRGKIDVNAPVAEYWPEFAQAGKRKALVRHVLGHTIGLLCFSDPGSLLDWNGHGWSNYEEIARRLAASPLAWEPGTKVAYHAMSFGWLLSELVRRVSGTTIGSFFREEIAVPLGLDFWIGTPPSVQRRLADVIQRSDGELQQFMSDLAIEPDTLAGQKQVYMHGAGLLDRLPSFFNCALVRTAEIAAGNGSAGARDLARMYAVLSCGGELDGARLVSPESITVFAAQESAGPDAADNDQLVRQGQRGTPLPQRYALGYELNLARAGQPLKFGPSIDAFGHMGGGGQIGFCDLFNQVAIGYVRNDITVSKAGPHGVGASNSLIDALYQCAGLRS